MKIYLVQHSDAKSKDDDKSRPLNDIGIEKVKKIGTFLNENIDLELSMIIHSNKLRSIETAEILAQMLKPKKGLKEGECLEPLCEVDYWFDKLQTIDETVMLVGHLPNLDKLASKLLSGNEESRVIDFKRSGVVCLARGESGNWSIEWIISPEIIK